MGYAGKRNAGTKRGDLSEPGNEEVSRLERKRKKLRKLGGGKSEDAPVKKKKAVVMDVMEVNLGEDAPVEIRGKWRLVNRDTVRANDFNYKRMASYMFDKLVENMRMFGWSGPPVIVRSGDENGTFEDGMLEIIDGEHRWKASEAVEMTEIPVQDLGNVPDAIAKTLIVTFNELHGKPDNDALSHLVAELDRVDSNLIKALPFDERETASLISAGATDLEALEKLGEEPGSTDVDDSESDEGADEDESADVAQFLGLYDLTPQEHGALQRRLTEEIVPHVKAGRKPGALLDKMISMLADSFADADEEEDDEETD